MTESILGLMLITFIGTVGVLWIAAPEWVGWWNHDDTDCDFVPRKHLDWATHPFTCKGRKP